MLLLSVALRHIEERAAGLDPERALLGAIDRLGEALDPATRQALLQALGDTLERLGSGAPVAAPGSADGATSGNAAGRSLAGPA
jgi:hypothetical protein